jgi:uncharacterized protein
LLRQPSDPNLPNGRALTTTLLFFSFDPLSYDQITGLFLLEERYMQNYHPLYLEFFQHYHQEEYWEAHEVLEELWQQDRKNNFYHGLIQIAAIMHQLKRGKVRGARKLSNTALMYLSPYKPSYEGVEVGEVMEWLQLCLSTLPTDVDLLSNIELQKLGIPICQLPEIN